jgi:hypothetical protein
MELGHQITGILRDVEKKPKILGDHLIRIPYNSTSGYKRSLAATHPDPDQVIESLRACVSMSTTARALADTKALPSEELRFQDVVLSRCRCYPKALLLHSSIYGRRLDARMSGREVWNVPSSVKLCVRYVCARFKFLYSHFIA